MRTWIRAVIVLSSFTALASCDLLKKKGAADADAAAAAAGDAAVAETPAGDAATTPAATTGGTGAVNENDVARFPDETKLADVQATVKRFASIRESPSTGKVVVQVNSGTTVTEIAQRQNFFLVTADSGGQKKMGWLTADAFTPIVDAGLKAPTCTSPEVPLMGDTPFCGKVCGGDVDCPAGQACKGTAQRFSANTLLPGTVAVCTVVSRPAGATPVATVIDAGPPPGLTQSADILPPPCPAGFVQLAKDKLCHRQCSAGAGVKVCKLFCVKCEGQSVCSNTRNCQ